ncbi:carbohydrate kinase family protein [Bacteroidota bacterium]
MKKIVISGLGCTLLDFIYNEVSFTSKGFRQYQSRTPGDGGLSPGQLVFLDDLEQFSKSSFEQVVKALTGSRPPDTINLGGPAAVPLIHAAQLLQDVAEVKLYAAMGNDNAAETILEIIGKTPLNVEQVFRKNDRTPLTYVFSDPGYDGGHGERTFVNSIGAAGLLLADELPESFFLTDIMVLGGTALVPLIHDALDTILEKASPASYKIVNTVYDFRNDRRYPGKPWPLGKDHGALKLMDLLIMDKDEALKISGRTDIQEAVSYFIDSGVKACMITDGVRPGIVYDSFNGNTWRFPVCDRIIEELKQANKGDTTGAGDNFVGGILFSIAMQLAKGKTRPDLAEAVKWGVISGGMACFHMGGTFIETLPGQKLKRFREYYADYCKQIEGGKQ